MMLSISIFRPYHCPLCFKRFQAKGDLPKHFFTSRHQNDPRIPPTGTPEWQTLLGQCCVVPEGILSRKKRQRRPKASSDAQNQDSGLSERPSTDLPVGNLNETGFPLVEEPTNFQRDDLPNEENQTKGLLIVPETLNHSEQESILSDAGPSSSSRPTVENLPNPTETENRANPFSIENILAPTMTTSSIFWPESESQAPDKSIFIKCDVDDEFLIDDPTL